MLSLLIWNCSNTAELTSSKPQPKILPEITFSPSNDTVEAYDFVEVKVTVKKPTAQNPFRDVRVTGSFGQIDNSGKFSVDGFCDSSDGSIFRIRFMPSKPGDYKYSVTYWQDNLQKVHTGTFKATASNRRGLVQVDPNYPWHFIWEGTGEHYFLNGTTAFLLMGWEDEKVILESLSRLHKFDINRVRVLLSGRSDHFWTEPIKPNKKFRTYLNPWVSRHPDDITNPGYDFTRFNIPYWQKFEKMIRHAREKDIIISVIVHWNDTTVHSESPTWLTFEWFLKSVAFGWGDADVNPENKTYWDKIKYIVRSIVSGWNSSLRPTEGSEDESRYLRYAVARLSPYSNITWDLGDDLDSFRDKAWTHDTGMWLQEIDAYSHLATSHPTDEDGAQDRSSTWFGMTSFQRWKRPLHAWMLEQRRQQINTGRIIPQVNEEYGYEDHYPKWAPYGPPTASADSNRRTAWEIVMAGGYQTTGETAKRGIGIAPDTGGGFINGRGDDTMIMLKGYAHIMHFFSSIEWWKTEPHDELVNNGSFCLAQPNRLYVIYLPKGGNVTANLGNGEYEAKWYNPRNGEYTNLPNLKGPTWVSPNSPSNEDWVILIKSK